jgi:hypothetical protein
MDSDGNKIWIVTDLIKTAKIFRQDAVLIVKPLVAFVDYYIAHIRPDFVKKYTVRGRIETDDGGEGESERVKSLHQSGTAVTVPHSGSAAQSCTQSVGCVVRRAVYRWKWAPVRTV